MKLNDSRIREETMDEPVKSAGFRWLVLLSMCLSLMTVMINMIAFAPLLPEIAKDLRVDMATVTNLMTLFSLGAAIAFIVGGALCDRLGIMFVAILGLLCTSVPAVIMPWIGTSYASTLWARVSQGASMGFIMCAMGPIIAIWFPPKEKGLASGLMGGSVGLGSAIGVWAAPVVFLAVKSWQQTVAWLSIVGWVGLAMYLAIVFRPESRLPSQSHETSAPVADPTSLKHALSASITWILMPVNFFMGWSVMSVYNLVPAYFAADKPVGIGLGPMMSGNLMLAVMIAGIVGPVIAGMLQDKVFHGNPKPVILIGFALACIFIYPIQLSIVHDSLPILVTFLTVSGLGLQFLGPCIIVFVSKCYPIGIVGKMTGLTSFAGSLGGPAGQFACGLALAVFGSYNGPIMLMSLGGLAGFILALLIPSRLSGKTQVSQRS
jgi:MFS family permease